MLTVVKGNDKNTRTMCTFDFEHIQQINLIFLLLTLNSELLNLPIGHWMKSAK